MTSRIEIHSETRRETIFESRSETRIENADAVTIAAQQPRTIHRDASAIPSNRVVLMDIHLETVAVYANGRQQIRVELEIEARDNDGNNTLLTDEEKRSIQLIDYRHPEQIVPSSEENSSAHYRGWAAQEYSLGYAPFPGTFFDGSGSHNPRLRSGAKANTFVTRYITSNGAAMESLVLAFSLVGIDNAIYRSNGTKTVGQTHYILPGCDVENRIVYPEVPHVYSSGSFVLEGLVEGEDNWFDRKLRLWIGDHSGPLLAIRSAECKPGGILLWDDFADTHALFTGYAGPSDSQLNWHPDIEYPEKLKLPELISEPGDDSICVVELCGRDNFYPKPALPDGALLPSEMTVHMVDVYGTSQQCRLRLVKGKWGHLEIY